MQKAIASISVACIAASIITASAQAQAPAAPVDVKPVPAIPGVDPTNRPAKLEVPADQIDPAAMAIFDRASAAAKNLKSLQLTSEMKIDGVDPSMLPPGISDPMTLSMEFGPDQVAPFKKLRIECAHDSKPTQTLAFDGTKGKLLDYNAKEYRESGSDWFQLLGGNLGAAIPGWLMEQRMQSGSMPTKTVSATIVGEETLDGQPCDVIRIVRELDGSEMDLGGGDEGDPAAEAPKMPTIRFVEVLAVAKSDSLLRRMSQKTEAVGGEAMGGGFSQSTVFTGVKGDVTLDDKAFTIATPDGFKEAEDGEDAPAGLKFNPGDKAPEFTLKDLADKEVTMASLAGKVVLMDFWATWCGPCKQAMPVMQKISDDYKDKGVVVLGVNMGERKADDGKKYMEKKGYTYTCLLAGDDLAKTYGITGIPTLVIVGKDGVIVKTEVGMANDGGKSLREAIDTALNADATKAK